MTILEGISVSSGLADGTAIVYDFEIGRHLEISYSEVSSSDVKMEWERLDEALEKSSQDLRLIALDQKNSPRGASLSLLSAHAAMTSEIATLVKKHIESELVNVEQALESVIGDWVERLTRLDSEYLRQREQDVRDVGRRMSRYLAGSLPWNRGHLPPESIVVARELMPSELIELANCGVVGIVTEQGGRYSHTAIIARSLGLPAITSVLHATTLIHPGMRLFVDGDLGLVTVSPSNEQKDTFQQRKEDREQKPEVTEIGADTQCITLDGVAIKLVANVGCPAEVAAVLENHLGGVGLFRTEFLFLESQERPTTSMQADVYSGMAKSLGGLPLVIRTFDLGGDKLPAFLLSEQSDKHSSLNLRGLRFSLAEGRLFESQIRAILQTAQTTDLRILLPMVIGNDGFARAIAVIEQIADQVGLMRTPLIGAMIETPAALYALDEILDLADFVAIGTNDLTQYMLATDRGLADESEGCTAMHPAVIKAIKQVSEAGNRLQCPVSVCGEVAGDADYACLLIGLGIRELSIAPARAAIIRRAIRGIDSNIAREIAENALNCKNETEVQELLTDWLSQLIEPVIGVPDFSGLAVSEM